MKYDFDRHIDRRGTNTFKWDWKDYSSENVIPMWVADMDFFSPPEVIEALHNRIDHGVFGYTFEPDELVEIIIDSLKIKYNWKIEKEWIVWLPGLVTGLNIVARTAVPGNEILTTVPVYPPFLSAPENSDCQLRTTRMKNNSGKWEIDFDDLSKKVTDKTKMFFLCNPHNPTGRMFTKDELIQLGEIAEKNNLVICSDEIHCDLILDKDKKHIPLASINREFQDRTITLMAPSKTYNIAGLGCSFAIISNQQLRENYLKVMNGIVPHVNLLGYTAALASYKYGKRWLEELQDYLRENRDLLQRFVDEIPGLKMNHIEATYLAWIDVKGLKLEDPFNYFMKAGVGFSNGIDFSGKGFLRMNFGCPRSILQEALIRIKEAISKLSV